eukprot:1175575-Prorocentrum_minimum.AAC.3
MRRMLNRAKRPKGIHSQPSRDWLPLRVYALNPRAIGSHSGYMLSTLARLPPAPGICSQPSRDRLPLRVYALNPRAIASRSGYILSTLARLAPAPGKKCGFGPA